jgi:hypothetical protein
VKKCRSAGGSHAGLSAYHRAAGPSRTRAAGAEGIGKSSCGVATWLLGVGGDDACSGAVATGSHPDVLVVASPGEEGIGVDRARAEALHSSNPQRGESESSTARTSSCRGAERAVEDPEDPRDVDPIVITLMRCCRRCVRACNASRFAAVRS